MTGASVAVAGLSILADRARSRRRNPDRPGWVPWPLVLLLSLIMGALCAAMALKA